MDTGLELDVGETLARDVLNALSANIAVLDGRGTIVAVNEAWTRFARANGAGGEHSYVGADYLAVCERALQKGSDARLEEIVRGLRAILAGEAGELAMEYPCDSPSEQRWFLLRATALRNGSSGGVVVAHEDITVRKRVEQALRETERKLRSVLDALPVGVWVMDRTGLILEGNPAGREIWAGARYVGPERFGEYKAWWLSTGERITADEWAAARAIRNGETSIGEEIEIECFDGTHKIIINSAVPLFDERHTVEGAIIVNQDITARMRDEAELRRTKEDVEAMSRELVEALARERILARVDPVTGTTNRRHFFELAAHELSVAARYEQPLSLILFDIDEFKRTNDTYGHGAGDELLKRVAGVVRVHLRDADLFARYGGDEFVVLLPHTAAAAAAIVAERIRHDVAGQSLVMEKGTVPVTISIGIAELLPSGDTLDALIHRADLALYQAKKAGRNRTAVFDGKSV